MQDFDKKELSPIGSGGYNNAFSYTDGFGVKQVVKIPRANNALSQPARAVRIWNEVHDEKTVGIATECKVEGNSAWMCPFIEEDEKSQCQDNGFRDLQLSAKLVEVFKKTGRIVLDITVPGNVTGGELVDVDQALQLPGRGRRGSDASINFFEKANSIFVGVEFQKFCDSAREKSPRVLATMAILLNDYTNYKGYNLPTTLLHSIKNFSCFHSQRAVISSSLNRGLDLRDEPEQESNETVSSAKYATDYEIKPLSSPLSNYNFKTLFLESEQESNFENINKTVYI